MKKILLFFVATVCAVASWAQTDAISAKYNGRNLEVYLDNETQFVAFQMDIKVPADLEVSGNIVSNLDRLQKGANVTILSEEHETPFEVVYNVISSDSEYKTIRVLAYNLGLNEIKGVSGKLFTIAFDAPVTEANISNILFVDKNTLNEKTLEAINASKGGIVGDVSGVAGVPDGVVDMFDVVALLNMYVGLIPETPEADVDMKEDGVTMFDVTIALNIYVGLITY